MEATWTGTFFVVGFEFRKVLMEGPAFVIGKGKVCERGGVPGIRASLWRRLVLSIYLIHCGNKFRK